MEINITYTYSFTSFSPVVSRSVNDDIHLLSYRIRFTDGDKKAGDIETVDAVVLPNYYTTDVIQVQVSHDV